MNTNKLYWDIVNFLERPIRKLEYLWRRYVDGNENARDLLAIRPVGRIIVSDDIPCPGPGWELIADIPNLICADPKNRWIWRRPEDPPQWKEFMAANAGK